MSPNRREFIKELGITLASFMMTRCVLPGQNATPRDRLRNCWLRFDWLAEETRDSGGLERGEKALNRLTADHQQALNELVANGELSTDVSEQVQVAFDAAAYHVWRSYAPITCYEPVLIDYKPFSSGQLAQQAAFLAELADGNGLDSEIVAQAQASIERDIAFLNLSNDQVQTLYSAIIQRAQGGGLPSFDEIDLEIEPDAALAAAFLVELLIEEGR